MMTIEEAISLAAAGIEVYMPVVVESPVSILDEDIYEGLPGRTDDDGNVLTFRDWGGEGNQPMKQSADGARILMSCTIFFEYIPSSAWMLFHGRDNIALHDAEWYEENAGQW